MKFQLRVNGKWTAFIQCFSLGHSQLFRLHISIHLCTNTLIQTLMAGVPTQTACSSDQTNTHTLAHTHLLTNARSSKEDPYIM